MHTGRRRDSLGSSVGSSEPPSQHEHRRAEVIVHSRVGQVDQVGRVGRTWGRASALPSAQSGIQRQDFVHEPFDLAGARGDGGGAGFLVGALAEDFVGQVQRGQDGHAQEV
jgi:hypothetical protein